MVYSYLVITIVSVIRDFQMLFLNIKLHSQLSFFQWFCGHVQCSVVQVPLPDKLTCPNPLKS